LVLISLAETETGEKDGTKKGEDLDNMFSSFLAEVVEEKKKKRSRTS